MAALQIPAMGGVQELSAGEVTRQADSSFESADALASMSEPSYGMPTNDVTQLTKMGMRLTHDLSYNRLIPLHRGHVWVVVENDCDVITSTERNVHYCVYGSKQHIAALEQRLGIVEMLLEKTKDSSDRRSLQNESDQLEKDIQTLTKPLGRLDEKTFGHGKAIVQHGGHIGTLEKISQADKIELIAKVTGEHLFRRPRIRQFYRGDVLIRENDSEERKATWNELFFDLVFVGVISVLGNDLAYDFNSARLARFILLFIPIWRTWLDTHIFLNIFDSEDLMMKILVYVIMVMVLGMGISSTNSFDYTGETFVACYLISRFVIAGHYFIYMLFIRKLKRNLFLLGAGIVLTSITWIVVLGLGADEVQYLWWVANSIDLFWHFFAVAVIYYFFPLKYRLAYNIEHYTERFGGLTIVALGEIVAQVVYYPYHAIEIQHLRAALALIIAYCLQWVYFSMNASKHFKSAMRRSVYHALMFTFLHLPLQMAIISLGAIVKNFIVARGLDPTSSSTGSDLVDNHTTLAPTPAISQPTQSDQWLLAGSVAVSLWCMALLGLLHKSLDTINLTKLSKGFRVMMRVVVGVIVVLIVIDQQLEDDVFLGVLAGLLVFIVFLEVYGDLRRDALSRASPSRLSLMLSAFEVANLFPRGKNHRTDSGLGPAYVT